MDVVQHSSVFFFNSCTLLLSVRFCSSSTYSIVMLSSLAFAETQLVNLLN